MNLADLSLVATILLCGLTAGLSAAAEKAGWFTVPIALGGLILGFGAGLGVRALAYFFLHCRSKQNSYVEFGLFLAYSFVPVLLAFVVATGTTLLTIWICRHLL